MYQRWSTLLFVHWTVPAELLRPLVPEPLRIDEFDGRAYVGLVPFTMSGIRPPWAPALPWISAFHETNVRTYVHFEGRDPGVWFFSLEAQNPLAVVVARAFWKLNYQLARMQLFQEGARVDYASTRVWPGPCPAECRVSCETLGPPAPAVAGTLEHFLTERYLLYTVAGRRLLQGQVHHAPYPLQPARATSLDDGLLAAAGLRPSGAPAHVLFSPGVDVEVFPLRQVARLS